MISSTVAIGPPVAVSVTAIALLQELLILALQLVVEDDAPDTSAVVADAFLGARVGAIDLCVVRQLARLAEAGVEGLAGLVTALAAARFEHVSPFLGEHNDIALAPIHGDGLDEAGFPQVIQSVVRLAIVVVPFEAAAQVFFGNDAKGADGREHPGLVAVDGVAALAIANQLALLSVRQAFNHIYASELTTHGQPTGSPGRRALVIAGDDADAKAVVTTLLDAFGFDTVDAGALKGGWRIQRDTPGYGPRRTAAELRADLAAAKRYADM